MSEIWSSRRVCRAIDYVTARSSPDESTLPGSRSSFISHRQEKLRTPLEETNASSVATRRTCLQICVDCFRRLVCLASNSAEIFFAKNRLGKWCADEVTGYLISLRRYRLRSMVTLICSMFLHPKNCEGPHGKS